MSNNLNHIKVVGITGFAKSGKDTLFSLLNKQYPDTFKRFAFADKLKSHIAVFISENFGFDVYNCTPAQKELIRPILIAFGCAKRKVDINYWVKEIAANIEKDCYSYPSQNSCVEAIPVITDFRFESEVKFFRDKYGDSFKLVEVIRLNSVDSIPDEEIREMPHVRPYVDYKIEWNTVGDNQLELLTSYITRFYENVLK